MRLHTLLAFIIVAAASTATAEERHEELSDRVTLGPHQNRYGPPRQERDWVLLASQTPTGYGTEYIVVGRNAGWFRTLRIDAIQGRIFLRQIKVFFHRGFAKTYYVNRTLDRLHPVAFVELGMTEQIDQIAVTPDRFPSGYYEIYGSSGGIGAVR